MSSLNQAIREMETVFAQVPYGIEHTRRVLANAETILAGENVSPEQREVVALAAVLHDIGALEALRKYGSMDGPYQEVEGEIIARQILERIGAPPEQVERVAFLVGHHHTPAMIDGIDFQILWEADQLDNLEYGAEKKDPQELARVIADTFKTAAGLRAARARLLS